MTANRDAFVAGGDIYYNYKSDLIDLQTVIRKERERLKDRAILPWFSDSRLYRDLFPGLFIKPNLMGKTASIDYDELKDYYGQNIAILGEAGAGKTTLLIYHFVFGSVNEPGYNCLYLTVKDALDMLEDKAAYVEKISQSIEKSGFGSLTILIDGVDEEFLNDYEGYISFLTLLKRLSECYSCSFWLGCRKDLFDQYRGEQSQFVQAEFVISPWEMSQAIDYIGKYESIVGCKELSKKINRLIEREEIFDTFSKNPFYLSLLTYIAEHAEDDKATIANAYGLYSEFFEVWFQKEMLRGTTEASIRMEIYPRLQEIAKKIYENSTVVVEDIDNTNSALRNLLVIKRSSYKEDRITAMYHRSIVSFLMAELIVQNMLDSTKKNELLKLFQMKIQDDVTNFVGSKYTIMTVEEKERVKYNLISLYHEMKSNPAQKDEFRVMEKCIYHLTRMNRDGLDKDVTDFLKKEIDPEPENPYMRLSLAYGCALSDNETVRAFALKYAKSISNETQDALINRSWTVVYFGDIVDDPYHYRDDKKCLWSKARAARIRRFVKEYPSLKDYRFLLFDIPLLYSFLKDRGWEGISDEEYQIINKLAFSERYFFQNEIAFLSEVKQQLLKDYQDHLAQKKKYSNYKVLNF